MGVSAGYRPPFCHAEGIAGVKACGQSRNNTAKASDDASCAADMRTQISRLDKGFDSAYFGAILGWPKSCIGSFSQQFNMVHMRVCQCRLNADVASTARQVCSPRIRRKYTKFVRKDATAAPAVALLSDTGRRRISLLYLSLLRLVQPLSPSDLHAGARARPSGAGMQRTASQHSIRYVGSSTVSGPHFAVWVGLGFELN